MRAYKFYSAKWGREALSKSRLKITTSIDINDPFELTAVSLAEKTTRRAFTDWRTHMFSQIGLISFCKDWANPVIWSHYAESHRGLCLGFDLKDDRVVNVEYIDERLDPSIYRPSGEVPDDEHLGFKLLRTKFRHWQYESEVRLFFPLDDGRRDGKLYFEKFGDSLELREVILGALYETSNDEILSKTIENNDVEIKTARLGFRRFEIIEQKMLFLKKEL